MHVLITIHTYRLMQAQTLHIALKKYILGGDTINLTKDQNIKRVATLTNSSFKGATIISIPNPSWASLPPAGALQWPLDSFPACVYFPGFSSIKISCTEISKSFQPPRLLPSMFPAPSTKDLTRRFPEIAPFRGITPVADLKRNLSTIYPSFQLIIL